MKEDMIYIYGAVGVCVYVHRSQTLSLSITPSSPSVADPEIWQGGFTGVPYSTIHRVHKRAAQNYAVTPPFRIATFVGGPNDLTGARRGLSTLVALLYTSTVRAIFSLFSVLPATFPVSKETSNKARKFL